MRARTPRKVGNIFDPIQPQLDQRVFDGIDPRPKIIKFIRHIYYDAAKRVIQNPEQYLDLYLTGSLTTYQWSDSSDCDISVFPHWDLLSQETGLDPEIVKAGLIKLSVDRMNGVFLPGGSHPLQFFIQPEGSVPEALFVPGVRSGWSFATESWVVPPEKERVHDVMVEMPKLYERAQAMAEQLSTLIDHDPEAAKDLWKQIHKKRQLDQQMNPGDFSEGNIVYKYIVHTGLVDRLRNELHMQIATHVKVSHPKLLYHVSPSENRGMIESQGLDPDKDQTGYGAVYLSVTPLPTEPGIDLWRVYTRGLNLLADESTPGMDDDWYMTFDPVPPQNLELLDTADLEYIAKTAVDWGGQLDPRALDSMEGMEPWELLEQQVIQLANQYGIRIDWLSRAQLDRSNWTVERYEIKDQSGDWDDWNNLEVRHVMRVPHITGELSYITALHEIGHAAFVQQYGAFKNLMASQEKELWCWHFALEHSQYPLSQKTLDWINESAQTYSGEPEKGKDVGWFARVAAEQAEGQSYLVIYDFENDHIILGVEAAERKGTNVIGYYDGNDITLHSSDNHWVNARYFRRLWEASYPTRKLRHIYFHDGDEKRLFHPGSE